MIILSAYNSCNKVYNEIDFKYNSGILCGGDIMRFNSLIDALLDEFDANNNAAYEQLHDIIQVKLEQSKLKQSSTVASKDLQMNID